MIEDLYNNSEINEKINDLFSINQHSNKDLLIKTIENSKIDFNLIFENYKTRDDQMKINSIFVEQLMNK